MKRKTKCSTDWRDGQRLLPDQNPETTRGIPTLAPVLWQPCSCAERTVLWAQRPGQLAGRFAPHFIQGALSRGFDAEGEEKSGEREQKAPPQHAETIHVENMRVTMTEQFQNPEVEKLEDEMISNPSKQKIIDRIANKLAEKTDKAAHENDKDESNFPI